MTILRAHFECPVSQQSLTVVVDGGQVTVEPTLAHQPFQHPDFKVRFESAFANPGPAPDLTEEQSLRLIESVIRALGVETALEFEAV